MRYGSLRSQGRPGKGKDRDGPIQSKAIPTLANASRQSQHENQHFRHRLVELRGNLIAEFDVGERARQHFVFFDRDIMGLRGLDDLRADAALALGDHPWRARSVVMQRDRELAPAVGAHSARSRKCPAGAEADCTGAPSRTTISPGFNSARLKAWLSCETPARNCAAVAGRSAHIRTEVRSPVSDTSAWTGPAGSTSSENRARHAGLGAPASRPPPSREISNCAIAVP